MIPFALLVVYLALLSAYALFLHRVGQGIEALSSEESTPGPEIAPLPTLTVVVPMRNEEGHVAACIGSLRGQEYPDNTLRFIIVDDQSTDGTAAAVEHEIRGDGRFTLLRIGAEAPGGKKSAIAAAIDCCASETILTTDADCTHGPRWAACMARELARGRDIVAGPVVYERAGGLFARLQALEFLGLVGVGAGLFGVGYPRLCNGANLAYRRTAFYDAGGFTGNEHIASGDDEFLLHSIVYRRGGEAGFAAAPDAVVSCCPAATVGAFISQRVRWASKGPHYNDGRFVAFLVILFCFFLCAATSPLLLFLSPWAAVLAGVIYMIKAGLDASVLFAAARLFRQPVRGIDLIIAELLHPFYLVGVSIAGAAGVFTWKDRKQT